MWRSIQHLYIWTSGAGRAVVTPTFTQSPRMRLGGLNDIPNWLTAFCMPLVGRLFHEYIVVLVTLY